MPGTQPTTISDHVEWALARLEQSDSFFGHGCDNARDEAIWVTLHVTGLIDHEYEDVCHKKVSREHSSAIQALIHARINLRKPLAYLIREAWFAGHAFYIDERVIVPRSHFGDLIQDGFAPWISPQSVRHVLDLCTGSGCIGIAMALKYPDVIVDAVDIDPDALDVARINVSRFGVDKRVRLVESDLFERLERNRYDLIVCNPPYVSSTDADDLPAEYHHEPRLALEAADEGLKIVKKILCQAIRHLSDNGHLLIELGGSAQTLESQFPDIPFLWLTSRSGESVVLLISAEQLKVYESRFSRN
ncbi:MAG: 50S ribosomal protein L3 N(5)-glutamine methyltransferase [Acidiferrobacterales bacterium]|nr:50S ribosomal protein L3 N(5)-glutamine methyltransferase [Acidiferrobacterales bacterium]